MLEYDIGATAALVALKLLPTAIPLEVFLVEGARRAQVVLAALQLAI